MSDTNKAKDSVEADLSSAGVTPAAPPGDAQFLTRLTDDLLEEVNGGVQHLLCHANVVIT